MGKHVWIQADEGYLNVLNLSFAVCHNQSVLDHGSAKFNFVDHFCFLLTD